MEKIEMRESVKRVELGRKYEGGMEGILGELEMKRMGDLWEWGGKELVRVGEMGRKRMEEIEDVVER